MIGLSSNSGRCWKNASESLRPAAPKMANRQVGEGLPAPQLAYKLLINQPIRQGHYSENSDLRWDRRFRPARG
jgi:hypothetical protein